jgi:dienelactone hydrolase
VTRGRLAAFFIASCVVVVVASSPAAAVDDTRESVATTTTAFVDMSRSTPATATQPADNRRVLETTIRYPRRTTHPLPLIVLAHGLNGHPGQLDELTEAWASAGYVVAAPRFPRVNTDANGKAALADAAEYPADLSFVIDRVLDASRDPASPLHDLVDSTRIGAAGISLGGMAVYGLVSNTCCIDRRIDAAILMSAVRPSFRGGVYQKQSMPVMLLHGDADTGYHWSVGVYPKLAPPKWFVTLRGGRHGPPFEDAPDEHDAFVRATTTAFWNRYLDHDRRAGNRIVALVRARRGKAKLQRDLG